MGDQRGAQLPWRLKPTTAPMVAPIAAAKDLLPTAAALSRCCSSAAADPSKTVPARDKEVQEYMDTPLSRRMALCGWDVPALRVSVDLC